MSMERNHKITIYPDINPTGTPEERYRFEKELKAFRSNGRVLLQSVQKTIETLLVTSVALTPKKGVYR